MIAIQHIILWVSMCVLHAWCVQFYITDREERVINIRERYSV